MPRPTSPSVAAADLDARCLDLRRHGASYREIARTVGLSVSNVHGRVMRGLDRTRREPADAVRELELERLDQLQLTLTRILARAHVTVSGGRIVKGEHGQPLQDDGPTISAAQALLRVQESRRRLLGLDAPVRHDLNARIHDEAYSIDSLDQELERVRRELAEGDPAWGEQERRRQDHEHARERFRAQWSSPGQVARDPAAFVGAALELAIDLLDLDDAQREAAGLEVERLLWTQQAAR